MKAVYRWVIQVQLWRDTKGQDMIEYALLGGFVALISGALVPEVSQSISTIFSKVNSVLSGAASS